VREETQKCKIPLQNVRAREEGRRQSIDNF
jgi:hypothetical protein